MKLDVYTKSNSATVYIGDTKEAFDSFCKILCLFTEDGESVLLIGGTNKRYYFVRYEGDDRGFEVYDRLDDFIAGNEEMREILSSHSLPKRYGYHRINNHIIYIDHETLTAIRKEDRSGRLWYILEDMYTLDEGEMFIGNSFSDDIPSSTLYWDLMRFYKETGLCWR